MTTSERQQAAKRWAVVAKWALLLCVIAWAIALTSKLTEAVHDSAVATEMQTYHAWVKLTGRDDITLEEWERLKDIGALQAPIVSKP